MIAVINAAGLGYSASIAAEVELSSDSAVWNAVAFEDAEALRKLTANGARPDALEPLSLMTPLMAAETYEIAATLIAAGADPNAADRFGRTPLHHSVRMREGSRIIPMLTARGADVNARAKDGSGATPMLCAVRAYLQAHNKQRGAGVILALSKAGADVNQPDAGNKPLLALAVQSRDAKLVNLLLEIGADPAAGMPDGRTMLDYSQQFGPQIADLIERALSRPRVN